MAFDPDQYLEQNKPSFDPDAYLASNRPTSSKKDNSTSKSEAFLDHYGNSALLGYSPQIQGSIERGLDYLGLNPSLEATKKLEKEGFKVKEPDRSYVGYRDQFNKKLETESKEHPYISGAGTFGGLVGGSLAGMGAAKALRGVGLMAPAVQDLSAYDRLVRAKNTGAVLGAVANPGDVEGEISPLQLEERGKNALIGAALGAGTQLAAEGVGYGFKKASDFVKRKAEEKAFKASGAMLRDFRKANDKEMVHRIGRTLLDDNIVTPLATPSDIAERTSEGMTKQGAKIGEIINELEDSVVKTGSNSAGLDRRSIAKSLREELLSDSNIPGSQATNKKILKLVGEFEKGGQPIISLSDAEALKRKVGDQINWKRLPDADIPLAEQVHRALYTKLKTGVEDGASLLETMVKGPSSKEFIKTKNAYADLATANKIAKDRVSRDSANRAFGLTDTISGGAGATVGALAGGPIGGVVGGAIGGVANKAARTYGNSLMATGGDAISRMLAKGQLIEQFAAAHPRAYQALFARRPGKFEHNNVFEIFDDPDVIRKLGENPELIDNIQDPRLRAEAQKRFGRSPSGQ